jgi:hypothetical protein
MAGRTAAAIAAIIATAAVAAPTASAGPRVDYKQMFTTQVPGKSTGTDVRLLYKNPNDPKGKPIRVRREEFTLPAGTTYDQTVVPDCTASDAEILLFGMSACPAASHIGSSQGATSMSGFGAGEDPIDLDFWDDAGVLVLWGRSHQFPAIGAVARGHQKGQTMTIDVPRSPGGPPDGESAVRRVHNVFPARSAGRRAFVRTPRKCPKSRVWTFRGRFTFADGAVEREVYKMRCKRPARRGSGAATPRAHSDND